jgi:putrescine transport system permease protein
MTDSSSSNAARNRWSLGARLNLRSRSIVIFIPYFWLFLFFFLPFLIVFKISIAETMIRQPPYTPLFGEEGIIIKGLNYARLFADQLYRNAYLSSLKMAAISTLICLFIGYPMAYGIARCDRTMRSILLMAIILPFWTSFLIRVYAWMGLLNTNGTINNFLISIGIIDQPIAMLYTPFAMYIGVIYSYLPFMILPLYANLEKMDISLLEAATDLGCRPWKAFLLITVPLSFPGIVAGSMLVFIPAVGEYVIPELLGGPDALMIGRVTYNEFSQNRDWPMASATAIALLMVLVVPLMIFQYYQNRETGAGK